MIEIRRAEPADAQGEELLLKGIELGEGWIAFDGDKPICLWGDYATSLLANETFVWYYPLADIRPYTKQFLRANRRYIAGLCRRYEILTGSADIADGVAVKWMQWLGFIPVETFDFGLKTLLLMRIDNGH